MQYQHTSECIILEAPPFNIPKQELAQFLIQGISNGFIIGYQITSLNLHSIKKQPTSSICTPTVVEEYLQTEVDCGRLAGPYSQSELAAVHTSRVGIISKRHQPGKWWLIVDLSYPKGHSVNDGIRGSLCELHYIIIDDAIQKMVKLGPGSLLTKIDIQCAFRLLPIHPLIVTCWPYAGNKDRVLTPAYHLGSGQPQNYLTF